MKVHLTVPKDGPVLASAHGWSAAYYDAKACRFLYLRVACWIAVNEHGRSLKTAVGESGAQGLTTVHGLVPSRVISSPDFEFSPGLVAAPHYGAIVEGWEFVGYVRDGAHRRAFERSVRAETKGPARRPEPAGR